LPSEQPQHEVLLTGGYWIDEYEVTNQAYQAFVSDIKDRQDRKRRTWGSNQFVGNSICRHFEDATTFGDSHIGIRTAFNGA
jgi:formylglycine-generating enzyme required for sulfatase activity